MISEGTHMRLDAARKQQSESSSKFQPQDTGANQGAVERLANPVHGQAAAPHHCVEGQCEMGGLMAQNAHLKKLLVWCRPRLKDNAYRALLDEYLVNPPKDDGSRMVQSQPKS